MVLAIRWRFQFAPAGPGTPLSCAGRLCDRDYERNLGDARSLNPNAVARCRGDISFGGDECVLKCKPGYSSTGASPPGCSGDQCVICNDQGAATSTSFWTFLAHVAALYHPAHAG